MMIMRPMILEKRIRRVINLHPKQAVKICRDAGWFTPYLERATVSLWKECPSSCRIKGVRSEGCHGQLSRVRRE